MLKLPKLGKFLILLIPLFSWPCEKEFVKPYTAMELLETSSFVPALIAAYPSLRKEYEKLLKAQISDKDKKQIEIYLKMAEDMSRNI